jgi:hypothetical protein
MASNYRDQMKYAVDMVFCIDATMSMYPILDEIKNRAILFYQDFKNEMDAKGKKVGSLRIRIVAFRDYFYDQEEAMLETDFFELPQMAETFEQVIKSIEPNGGGDDPEDGLEALAYAIKSDWNMDAVKKRHVIVLWSDDGTHDLGFGRAAKNYPRGMAENFEQLTEWWGSKYAPGIMDESAKRLILFTPSKESWTTIRSNWNNVIHYESEAGKGIAGFDYEQILNAISNTI